MQTGKRKIAGVQRTARVLLKIILFLFLFFVFIFLLLLTPPVQNFLTIRVENYLEEKLQTKVEIGRISVMLPNRLSLQDVYLEDQSKDTLLAGGEIKARINFLQLFENELRVKDIQLSDITAKVKRELPDTTYNFQFIVDAFATEQTKRSDTALTTVLRLDADKVGLNNVRIVYNDVVTGSDMWAHINVLNADIDTLNPYQQHYEVPELNVKGMTVRFTQRSPLATPEPIAKDVAEAALPSPMKLNFGKIQLEDFKIDYSNNVSSFYTNLDFDYLLADGKKLDLQNRMILLDELTLNDATSAIKLGATPEAKAVEKEIEKEVKVQKERGWSFAIDRLNVNNNIFQFDNDNKARKTYGIDYAHILAEDLTLHIENFIMSTDSIGGIITEGRLKEKNGFVLSDLQGDILYAYNQAYAKGLHIVTPGTDIKRNIVLEYSSYDALVEEFEKTIMDVELVNSKVQVKDILAFAPDLRTHPAFANPNDIWHLNIVGNGNMDHLHFESLQFDGLQNTQIDAHGTLAGLTNPTTVGATFTINKLHTTQTDISLFTGKRLSTPDVKIPESFDVSGTVAGNMSALRTNLNIYTSAGALTVNGRFSNLNNPNILAYNTNIRTRALRLDQILKDIPVGSITANLNFSGKGFDPENINTNVSGTVHSIYYNRYNYRNIRLDGSLRGDAFQMTADINDPNIDLKGTASGRFSQNSSFKINAFVDSIKTMPLGFTTEPMTFRGKVDADIASLNPDYLEGNVLITEAIFFAKGERLPVDTISLVSARADSGQYIRLTSDIANAEISGQYRVSELGYIIENNIDPYFNITTSTKARNVQPYNIRFYADVSNSPFLSAILPGIDILAPLHTEGTIVSGQGINAVLNTESLNFNNNQLTGLNMKVATTSNGLEVTGNLDHLVSGTFDIYSTEFVAIINNNIIDFKVGVDDKASKDKYNLAGRLTQPSKGTYIISLTPGSLLLNYEQWDVSPGNQITISPSGIRADNFTLQSGSQQMALQTLSNGSLNVNLTDFRLATITGFMRSDTLLADGRMNGTVNFRNLMEQPLFTSDLTINDFSFRQDTLGNLNLQVSNTAGNRYITNATLTGRGNDVQITGSMTQQGKDVLMDLDLAIRQLDLSTAEGAFSSVIKNASGTINGSMKLRGTLATPDLQGNINFNNTSFNTVLLGGDFKVDNESLAISNDGIQFDNFVIRDSANNELRLNGLIQTTNFINYYFNLDVVAENFKLLNTTKKHNKIYWGDLVVSTNLRIRGTESSPIIDGALTINDGTNLTVVVPQKEPGVAQREGIVEFVDMDATVNDSIFRAYDSLNYSRLIGFDIAINAEVKKEAILNLVIDEANGDFVNVQGEALLTTGIDPSGKITLTGSYEIERGAYQLSFNFIQRKFEIQKGSKIVWLGEPTRATLDVEGIYVANTAPLDLVQDQLAASQVAIRNSYFMQKLPFEVHLDLTGELMAPKIAFDIVLPDRSLVVSRDVIQIVEVRLQQIRQEPSELNKQVFALLLLNRFIGENPFESSSESFSMSDFAKQSVSRLLTEQLNNLASGLIQGVDINFGITSTDDYTTGDRRTRTDLNVSLSKQLLNDRLTVVVGSNFELDGSPTGQENNQNASSVIGDISVNYKLSKDGRYMLRAYRRNQYEGVIEGYVIESGLGFSINVDYDHFRELFNRKKAQVEGIDVNKSSVINNAAKEN